MGSSSTYPDHGNEEELTLMGLIFRASMRRELHDDDEAWGELTTDIRDISLELDQELQKEGVYHRYANKTLRELRKIYSQED